MERSLMPQRRRRSREIALQILYSLDMGPDQSPQGALALFPLEEEETDVVDYASRLVRGVWEKRFDIDDLLRTYLTGWRPERLVAVDRTAVRMALYEGVVEKLTPVAVAISEAVELAKRFGTEDSGRFVNGVLGRIVRELEGVSDLRADETE
ncbi:transcription antitermination factor NusB [Aminithiophilus ramosus]|uniref:Transcription antitermination protein NusB n=2 Tax=Synergistales TaxID=649776 RepID=A0A9Q7EYP9_9BACT|nr:transcription antitermination factor NusB [Aminithiophilus ramosus]QVL37624.1 transcription antitermination factor NusB [Synergistota bacterium]